MFKANSNEKRVQRPKYNFNFKAFLNVLRLWEMITSLNFATLIGLGVLVME